MAAVGRALKDASELGRALDIIVATQGADSPALSPLIRELTNSHKVLQGVYEGATGQQLNAPPAPQPTAPQATAPQATAPQPTAPGEPHPRSETQSDDVSKLEARLEETETRFHDLKQSVAHLVQFIEHAPKRGSGDETGSALHDDQSEPLFEKVSELEREINRHRDVEVSLLKTMRDVREANEAKSNFMANMSHEIRTPLNAIIGFAEIMESELIGPLGSEQYVDYAKDVRESGQHLLEVINDILDLSKIEAGQLEAGEEEVDLRDAIEACARMIGDQAREAEVTLTLDLAPNIPHIRANARMVRQIILNLLTNAVKFTNSGGKVTLHVTRGEDSGDLIIRVEDTGVGIPADDQDRILRAFEQVEKAGRPRGSGTGLGLPMSKSLTELHGGSLNLQSELGVGTIVTVRLPADRVYD
jgi:signal transduction histidine kinase